MSVIKISCHFFDYLIKLEDGNEMMHIPTSAKLSLDCKVLTINHTDDDLSGQSGVIIVDDYENPVEVPFDFK